MNEANKPIKVLLVDDDPEDVDLTLEVMELSKLKLDINIARDGIEAVEFLEKQVKEELALPDLILLDLNMPRMNGHEVLSQLKSDKQLCRIPVVVLTTSSSDEDILKSYSTGVSCYVTKPVGLKEFSSVVEAVNNFWFTVVKFPGKN